MFIGDSGICPIDFQSPFHRGKECNVDDDDIILGGGLVFQSPFHRGKECNWSEQPFCRQ